MLTKGSDKFLRQCSQRFDLYILVRVEERTKRDPHFVHRKQRPRYP